MPAVPFPTDLRPMLRASKSRAQPAAFSMAQPRRGFPFAQSVGTETPVIWDAVFRFTQAQAQVFLAWFQDDIANGVNPFELPIRTEFGLIDHECIFLPEGLLDNREVGEVWEYRAQILARAQVIPADAVTAWGGAFVGPIADPSLSVGSSFSLSIASAWTGGLGPFTYRVVQSALPPGVYLNPLTGVVSGTPSASGTWAGVIFERAGAYCSSTESNDVTFTVGVLAPSFTTYFAEDLWGDPDFPITTHTNSSVKFSQWQGVLTGLGVSLATEDFETQTTGATSPLVFTVSPGGVSVQVTINGAGVIFDQAAGTSANGRHSLPSATSSKFWQTEALTTSVFFEFEMDRDIRALGFFTIDVGDFDGEPIIEVLDAGGTPVVALASPWPPRPGSEFDRDGGVAFWGVIGDNASSVFRKVRVKGSTLTGDVFAFDRLSIAGNW